MWRFLPLSCVLAFLFSETLVPLFFHDLKWTWQWRLMWLHLGMLKDNNKSHLSISKSTAIHLLNLPCTCNGCRALRSPVPTHIKWLKMMADNDMSLRCCSREVSKLISDSTKDCVHRSCQGAFIYQFLIHYEIDGAVVYVTISCWLVWAQHFTYANLNKRWLEEGFN